MIILSLPGVSIKPYVRMTKRGKYVDPQALEYLASKDTLAFEIRQAMQAAYYDPFPAQTPLQVHISVTVPSSQGHRADIDNIAKAILDACNKIVFPDDRWIDTLYIKRKIGEPYLRIIVAPQNSRHTGPIPS